MSGQQNGQVPPRPDPVRVLENTRRTLLQHVIHEYARHNGHADLLRERIDGATGY